MKKNETESIIGRAQVTNNCIDAPAGASFEPKSVACLNRKQPTFALAGIILPLLALNMIEGLVIVAVPRDVAALNGFARYSWPSTSFLVNSTISMPVFAKLSDLYGRKWFYLFGASMSVAYAVLCGAAGVLPIPLYGMSQIVLASALLGRTGWYRSLAMGGSGLTAIGLLMSRMGGGATQPEVLCNLILCGIRLGVLTPTYEVLIQNGGPAGTMGVATGLTQFFRAVGGSVALAILSTRLLRIYHMHVDYLMPPAAPPALRQAFDNPLQPVFKPPNPESAASGVANARDLVRRLLDGSRAGLTFAMQSIFFSQTRWLLRSHVY